MQLLLNWCLRLTDIENNLVVPSGEREGGRAGGR